MTTATPIANPLLDSPTIAPPTPSELDDLISRDPLDLSAQDIDAIIAMQRQYRARLEAGVKPKRGGRTADAPKVSLDLATLGLLREATKPAELRSTGQNSGASGFRRRL